MITSLSCSGRRGRDRMVVGFTTTCAISAYHHYSCEFKPCLWRGVLDTALCDKVFAVTCDKRFSPGTTVSSTNKTERHDITEILLKVTLNTINQPIISLYSDPCIAKSYTFDPFIVSKKGHGCKCE